MQKINFQNLPSTLTPVSASNLNDLQNNVEDVFDGVEPMGNIVVDSIKGKNLFGGFGFRRVSNGITFNYNGDGTITVDGTSTGTAYSMTSSEKVLITLPAGTYTISGGLNNIVIQVADTNGDVIVQTTSSVFSNTFTLSATSQINIRLKINSGNTFTNEIVSVLLEKGNTATDFTQYQGIGYISGSNANGNYIKYDDGTLITYQRVEWTGTVNTAWGTLYQSAQINLPRFPVPFIEAPTITYSVDGTGKVWLFNNGSTTSTTQPGAVCLARPTTLTSGTFYISVIAIGRWK